MLLSITNTSKPATDLGYLLHKNPSRCQKVKLAFGSAHLFYPVAGEASCTACLLLNIDPIEIVRGKAGSSSGGPLDQYVNDRPYVASSFLSVALAKVFGSALQGRCAARPELAEKALDLTVRLSVLPCRGGRQFLCDLFEPLGYAVEATRHPLGGPFETWGQSVYHTVELKKKTTLKDVLTHLYVLVPVLDNHKHYYVGEAELENLLAKGEGWLAQHPRKEEIARRYLKHRISLARQALARLLADDAKADEQSSASSVPLEALIEEPLSLNEQRIRAVLSKITDADPASVIDMGCGEGRLIKELIRRKTIEKITGVDVSIRSLEYARKRIGLDGLPGKLADRVSLFHGSLMYRDKRYDGYDVAVVMEVVEHFDPPRLAAFERVVFAHARPKNVILTTPNREYNAVRENLPPDALRHGDHRFEWTRDGFHCWAEAFCKEYGYSAEFYTIGPEAPSVGAPTQMGVFKRGD